MNGFVRPKFAPTHVGDYNHVAADVRPRKSLRVRGSDGAEFESPLGELGAGLLTSATDLDSAFRT